jgi:hypothetical protein
MSKVVYVSKSRIERKVGPLRIAYLPGEAQRLSSASTAASPSITKWIPRNLPSLTPPQLIT